jgi:hypothetical protein
MECGADDVLPAMPTTGTSTNEEAARKTRRRPPPRREAGRYGARCLAEPLTGGGRGRRSPSPTHPQTARDRWRLRKKLNCGAHMSASGEGTIRNMCTQIRSDTGAQRLEDVENGENQGEEELQWQISK